MKRENIWKLLARKMKGDATAEELTELEELLRDDPEMKYTAETFSRLWNESQAQTAEKNGAKSTDKGSG